MPTFLTNARMNSALAARVEASVTGRKGGRGSSSLVRRIVSSARLVLVLAVAFAIYTGLTARQRAQRDLEKSRAELLEAARAHGATVTAEDRGAVARAESWVTRLSHAYEGDLVADDIRTRGGLKERLRRPAVYLRGPIDSLQTPEQIAAAAAISGKDALLLCLIDPPAARTEAALLENVRIARAGGQAMEDRTSNVRRLHEAIVGLPFLLPEWSERVRTAEDGADLARLRRDLERAPLERAKQALHAELLVTAIDEPGDGRGPTELDGERPHDVRVAVVDLPSAKVLLRVSKHVDPSWISVGRRPLDARALDGCALAFDVHEATNRAGR